MKQIVVDEPLDEIEVHPSGFYERLVEVCLESANDLLSQSEQFVEMGCPACRSIERKHAFDKHGYSYWVCTQCVSLYVSPRPSKVQMQDYIYRSKVTSYRQSDEYILTMQRRFSELAARRAEWIASLYASIPQMDQRLVVDIENQLPEYLLALKDRGVKPLGVVAHSASKQADTQLQVEDLSIWDDICDLEEKSVGLFSAFNILEHMADPGEFIDSAYQALEPGGILVMTTRSGSGFDIQVLWEYANVFPLEHINLISVEGIREMLNSTGFKILEVSTPGRLDVQIVERTLQQQGEKIIPRFVAYFLKHRDQYAREKLQHFLQENLLSSYMRVVAQKPHEP